VPTSQQELNWISKNLIEVLPAAVYVCNLEGVVVAFNRRATELWGRTPKPGDTDEKFCGSHKLYRSDGTYMPHVETPMEAVLRTGDAALDQEAIVEQPNGVRLVVLVNIAPLFNEGGKQIGAVNCFQDLSAQKQSEKDRESLREELRQSQKLEAMGQLVGGVAHDFNNLLTPIMGSLDLLCRRGLRDEREKRLIDGALQSAERAKTLVQRLLAFARRQPLQLHAISVGDLLTGLTDLISSMVGSRVKLTIDVAPNLSLANADANQLEMAVLNLCLNARDAMPDGGTIAVRLASEMITSGHRSNLPSGNYLYLSIEDTGTGMDEATMARALEPFYSTKEVGEGTGLGLSIVEGLVSQLGGALTLRSKLGSGTTIQIWLPVSAELIEADETSITVPPIKAVGTVLLVDDEDLVRVSTADMLTDSGFIVVEAASGAEALKILEQELHFDFLVTDYMMPKMTGLEVAGAFRQKHPASPVLLISGFAGADAISPNLSVLSKPFRQAELLASLVALEQK
jgi:signal transduction histidine kinase/CheY-like chemotaxis protein